MMCLGIPGKIIQIYDDNGILMGILDFGGVTREVCLAALPDAIPGDYAIVHAGFAISRLDQTEAKETLDVLNELSNFQDGQSSEPLND
jgi:hydrogenase expression/formation protein HypC